MKKILLAVNFLLLAVSFISAQDGSAGNVRRETSNVKGETSGVKADSIMAQLVKDIGKYELFDSAKDIDSNIKELRGLQQKRMNELLQNDVLYNRYDAIISTLLQIRETYKDKKVLQNKNTTQK